MVTQLVRNQSTGDVRKAYFSLECNKRENYEFIDRLQKVITKAMKECTTQEHKEASRSFTGHYYYYYYILSKD